MVVSEWLLFKLAGIIGKTRAQEKLQALIRVAGKGDRIFKDILLDDPDIGPYIADENLEYLEQPERYCGLAVEIVDDTLNEVTAKRQNDPEDLL
jgi:adenylosuccinate lyase